MAFSARNERAEEIELLQTASDPANATGMKYVSGSFRFKDSVGVFNPRTDELSKVSSNDTTPDYLVNKLVGEGVTLSQVNDGSNETLKITVVPPVKQTVFKEVTADSSTSSSSFVDLLSQEVTTVTGSSLLIFISVSCSSDQSSCQASFRLTVDGVAKRGFSEYWGKYSGNSVNSGSLVYKATGLSAGAHTIKLQWCIDDCTLSIRPVSQPGHEHGSILIEEVMV